jgi:hypothetical protein
VEVTASARSLATAQAGRKILRMVGCTQPNASSPLQNYFFMWMPVRQRIPHQPFYMRPLPSSKITILDGFSFYLFY